MKPAVKGAYYAFIALLLVALRVIHLDADPPSWLSWSSGLYTDEGIYAADARSAVLFHHWNIGDFHSGEIAPLQHLFLFLIFRFFGVSLSSVRCLSVVASLLSLPLFYDAIRRQFDEKTALFAVIFLGFSPVYLFYNRLGLLETPAVFFLIAALFLINRQSRGWLAGAALALAAIYKPLAILCIPAFFSDIRNDRSAAKQRLLALIAALAVYFICWELPHYSDLSRWNHYYLVHQYLPHGARQLAHNIVRSLWSGSSDGLLPYMILHAPVLLVLGISAVLVKPTRDDLRLRPYFLWLLVPFTALCFMSYEPSRYFVLFWPGLAVIAAAATARLQQPLQVATIAVFILVCACVILPYEMKPTYTVETAGKQLGKSLQTSQIIAGQYAPELSLSNGLNSIYVQPGFANSSTSLDAAYILVTTSPYWNGFWEARTNSKLCIVPGLDFHLPNHQNVVAYYPISSTIDQPVIAVLREH